MTKHKIKLRNLRKIWNEQDVKLTNFNKLEIAIFTASAIGFIILILLTI